MHLWDQSPRPPGIFLGMERNDILAERKGEIRFEGSLPDAKASFLFRLSLGRLRPRRACLRFAG